MPFVLAALAVLTLALVATVIPKKPARVENSAPARKHTAVTHEPIPTPMSTKSKATNTISILYSASKKACAPSDIAPEISFIFSFPSSAPATRPDWNPAKINAQNPSTGTRYITVSKVIILDPPYNK